ncbi:MAG: hypothetical protein GF317_06755 [Candidatus Lokiarchaeota archaeon]|nr:hypothetical protein [Candidatus Lokiarchaeota archaeon]MBD3199409.1 hypothetical protein [Candidatus Lokiarchaeota archaeon]
MNLQFYDTLTNKSSEHIKYYIENIKPKFSENILNLVLNDLKAKKRKKDDLIDTRFDQSSEADLSKLEDGDLELLYKVFVSRELNTKVALKWRLYQYLKFCKDINIDEIHMNLKDTKKFSVDFIIETVEQETILITCVDILENDDFEEIIKNFSNFSKSSKILPHRIIIATHKTYRDIPINEKVTIQNNSVLPELWVEWYNLERPFNGEDLIILNDNELNIAAYNFTSIKDILDYIYKYTEGGQIALYRQIGYFSETDKKIDEVEMIWKGIMIKT